MSTTIRPIPTDVVINRFFNGFINGFVFSERTSWISNVEQMDEERFDLDFIISVWRLGARFGIACREGNEN